MKTLKKVLSVIAVVVLVVCVAILPMCISKGEAYHSVMIVFDIILLISTLINLQCVSITE